MKNDRNEGKDEELLLPPLLLRRSHRLPPHEFFRRPDDGLKLLMCAFCRFVRGRKSNYHPPVVGVVCSVKLLSVPKVEIVFANCPSAFVNANAIWGGQREGNNVGTTQIATCCQRRKKVKQRIQKTQKTKQDKKPKRIETSSENTTFLFVHINTDEEACYLILCCRAESELLLETDNRNVQSAFLCYFSYCWNWTWHFSFTSSLYPCLLLYYPSKPSPHYIPSVFSTSEFLYEWGLMAARDVQ